MIEWLRKLIGPEQGTLDRHNEQMKVLYFEAHQTHKRHVAAYDELAGHFGAERARANRAEDEAAAARAYADSLVPDELRKAARLCVVEGFPAVYVKDAIDLSNAPEGSVAKDEIQYEDIPPIQVCVEVGVPQLDELANLPAATRAEMVVQHVDRAIGSQLKAELTRAIANQLGQ